MKMVFEVCRSQFSGHHYALCLGAKGAGSSRRIAGPSASPWTTERTFTCDDEEIRKALADAGVEWAKPAPDAGAGGST